MHIIQLILHKQRVMQSYKKNVKEDMHKEAYNNNNNNNKIYQEKTFTDLH